MDRQLKFVKNHIIFIRKVKLLIYELVSRQRYVKMNGNNKSTGQHMRMHKLVCAFAERKHQRQVYSCDLLHSMHTTDIMTPGCVLME